MLLRYLKLLGCSSSGLGLFLGRRLGPLRPPTFLRKDSSMAGGGEHIDESQFKGLARYFNAVTDKGRANTAKLTYGLVGLTIAYFVLRPKKQKQPAPAK